MDLSQLDARTRAAIMRKMQRNRLFKKGMVVGQGEPPPEFWPESAEELEWCLSSTLWRISSGYLYKILVKQKDDSGADDDSEAGLVMRFRPNRAQRRLLKRLWYRNVILKARQLGFTTLICIMFLDQMLFGEKNQRAAIIAHTEDAAIKIFRDKVKFAYNNLPPSILARIPIMAGQNRADELMFANGNSIQVAVTARSGTLHLLHVSEMGKISKEQPARADEVITGSIPTLAGEGRLFIESTAEGAGGHFYLITTKAAKNAAESRPLKREEYRFHFYPWWDAPEYRTDPKDVAISETMRQYFDEIETINGIELDEQQKAWYVLTLENVMNGQTEKMWQEYPSYWMEAFKRSNDGAWFKTQMIAMRKTRRIGVFPYVEGYPCYTFWDIGAGDGTAIWVMQHVQGQWRCIKFFEGWAEGYGYYKTRIDEWQAKHPNVVWYGHFLPHDGGHERQGMDEVITPAQMLERLGMTNITVLPRIADLHKGIQITRAALSQLCIDKAECSEGIDHLDLYSKKWNNAQQRYMDLPEKGTGHSEAADAIRQWAQALELGILSASTNRNRERSRARGGARTV